MELATWQFGHVPLAMLSWQLGKMAFYNWGNVDFALLFGKVHLASNSSQFDKILTHYKNSNVDLASWQSGIGSA